MKGHQMNSVGNSTAHGTPARYRRGCRCDKCTKAMRKYWAERYHESTARLGKKRKPAGVGKRRRAGEIPHGTWNGYCNYGCRCDACLEACRAQYPKQKAWREANRERLNAHRRDYYHNTVKPREEAAEAARKAKKAR